MALDKCVALPFTAINLDSHNSSLLSPPKSPEVLGNLKLPSLLAGNATLAASPTLPELSSRTSVIRSPAGLTVDFFIS